MSTGLWAPTELSTVPRTIFDNDGDKHFYDQIAWFSNDEDSTPRSLLQSLKYGQRAGTFDFLPYTFAGLTRNEVSWRMSDHYPLWVEFKVDAP